MSRCLAMGLLAATLILPIEMQGQGYGMFNQKKVVINRLLPPAVNLNGKHIRVEASAAAVQKDSALLQDLLRTKLITMIQRDPRFILDDDHPQTILRFVVTNYYTEEWIVDQGTARARKAYRGKIEVSYQALDAKTKAPLDSENLTETAGMDLTTRSTLGLPISIHQSSAQKQKEAASLSENETRDQLVTGIVQRMGKRVAPVDEPTEVQLPGKKLEPLSNLALNHRWGTLEEQADSFPKLPKPEDDCYRQFLVALAKEAEAYELTHESNDQALGKRADITPKQADEDVQRAQKYFDQAGRIYKEILAINPKDKEFRAGDTRIEETMTIYATIERYKQESEKAMAAQAAAAAQSQPQSQNARAIAPLGQQASASASTVSPLDKVLKLCGNSMPADVVKGYIQSPSFLKDAKATHYSFDMGDDPLKLSDSCGQSAADYQRLMRARLSPTPAKAPAKKP